MPTERIGSTASDEGVNDTSVDGAQIKAFAEFVEINVRTVLNTAIDDGLRGTGADILDRCQAKTNTLVCGHEVFNLCGYIRCRQ
jgi:hypothetical protein